MADTFMAALVTTFGSPTQLRQVPIPDLEEGGVLVRVDARQPSVARTPIFGQVTPGSGRKHSRTSLVTKPQERSSISVAVPTTSSTYR